MPECTLVCASRVEGSKDDASVLIHARHGDWHRVASGAESISDVEFDPDAV